VTTELNSKKKTLIDPKQISAWIALGATIVGLLTGLVKVAGSTYNPIDTVLIYIFMVALMLYAVTFATGFLLGLSTLLFGEDYLKSPVTFVIFGILIAIIAIPAGINSATRTVRDTSHLDTLGLTFTRFVGVGVIVLAAWLMYRYVLVPRNQDKNRAKPNGI
jgi:prolipoprotein diacylglyceryltransferase